MSAFPYAVAFAALLSASAQAAETDYAPATATADAMSAPAVETAAPEAEDLTAPAAEAAPIAEPALSTGSVARAIFTSAVVDREPVDALDTIGTDVQQVVFFSELQDLAGQTVTHRWEHAGEVLAEVPFQVGGARWRVWSSKNLMPEWAGEWTVSVVNGSGEVIEQARFQYVEAAQPAEQADEVAPAAELQEAAVEPEHPAAH